MKIIFGIVGLFAIGALYAFIHDKLLGLRDTWPDYSTDNTSPSNTRSASTNNGYQKPAGKAGWGYDSYGNFDAEKYEEDKAIDRVRRDPYRGYGSGASEDVKRAWEDELDYRLKEQEERFRDSINDDW